MLGEQWFVFRTDTARPLTEAGARAASEDIDVAEERVVGLMVLTQTCDLVRRCSERPYVDVCPLVEVDEAIHHEIERWRRPNYAFIPALAGRHLVADLDRVMTVEKSVVAGWERVTGSPADADARRLSLALARKRARVAFPDDFSTLLRPLSTRLSSKHDKNSGEGRALRALEEVRVLARPSWDAAQVSLIFWFIRPEGVTTFEHQEWDRHLEAWEKLLPCGGRFVVVDATIQTWDDLTAKEYRESDPLDLDHLSTRSAAP